MNPLDIEVSYYPGHVSDVKSTATVNLYDYLTNPPIEQIAKVCEIRSCTDSKEQNELKKAIGGITPSGIFSPSRSDENLVKHSGIITLDIDADKNPRLDLVELRNRVQMIEWVAACMISVRGAGLAIYVPIEKPEKHREHFESLSAEFSKMGVKVDPTCVNLSRLRFNSYDPEIYINPSATLYTRQLSKTESAPRRATRKATTTHNDVFSWAAEQVKRSGVHFNEGSKHDFITRLSMILNKHGVPENETWEHVVKTYIPRSEIHSNCVSGPYRIYAYEHGTRTFKPSRGADRARYGKIFPKRTIAPKIPSLDTVQKPEPIWQEVTAFEWDLPQTITQKPKQKGNEPIPTAHPLDEERPTYETESFIYFTKAEPPQPENWEQDITELETFFASTPLPDHPVKLDVCSTITHVPTFIEGHMATVKANNGKRTFEPYLERLRGLSRLIDKFK